jgi:hypothetical protein
MAVLLLGEVVECFGDTPGRRGTSAGSRQILFGDDAHALPHDCDDHAGDPSFAIIRARRSDEFESLARTIDTGSKVLEAGRDG